LGSFLSVFEVGFGQNQRLLLQTKGASTADLQQTSTVIVINLLLLVGDEKKRKIKQVQTKQGLQLKKTIVPKQHKRFLQGE
jgi:hypothetical protein